MKRVWLGFLLLLWVGVAYAGEAAFYKQVCRSDDPFVYCTQGCKETKAWKPLSVGGSGYANAGYKPKTPPYCPYPTMSCCDSYCALRPWPQRDYNDYYQNRVTVCPAANKDGKWIGSGRPESTPVSH